jgi:hypothetical protein
VLLLLQHFLSQKPVHRQYTGGGLKRNDVYAAAGLEEFKIGG